ncbi:MAG: hypothetical protein M3P96_03825 [Actinomycetota bacterium]|nr:hypothetical protein [Actinomycetota bacterium]
MKPRTRNSALISVATAMFSLSSAYRDLRTARTNGDRLAVIDAVASLVAVATGLAMAYRTIRNGGDS